MGIGNEPTHSPPVPSSSRRRWHIFHLGRQYIGAISNIRSQKRTNCTERLEFVVDGDSDFTVVLRGPLSNNLFVMILSHTHRRHYLDREAEFWHVGGSKGYCSSGTSYKLNSWKAISRFEVRQFE